MLIAGVIDAWNLTGAALQESNFRARWTNDAGGPRKSMIGLRLFVLLLGTKIDGEERARIGVQSSIYSQYYIAVSQRGAPTGMHTFL